MLGRIVGSRRGESARMRWLDSITESMDMNLSKLQEMAKSGDPGVLKSMGSKTVGHDLPTEEELQVPL